MKNQMSILTRGLVGVTEGPVLQQPQGFAPHASQLPNTWSHQHMARQVFVVIRVLFKGRCKRELIDSRRQVHQGQLRSEAG